MKTKSKQIAALIAYINDNVVALHELPEKSPMRKVYSEDTITASHVVSFQVKDGGGGKPKYVRVVVDRGTLGTPVYYIDLDILQKHADLLASVKKREKESPKDGNPSTVIVNPDDPLNLGEMQDAPPPPKEKPATKPKNK